jgi:hypothetical protein
MGTGTDRQASAKLGDNENIVEFNFSTPNAARLSLDQWAQMVTVEPPPFWTHSRTPRQVIVDRIIEWFAIIVSIAIFASVSASFLRFTGLWYW